MLLSPSSLRRTVVASSLLGFAATLPALALFPAPPAPALISEFRLRGPNPNGAQNEYIEIYNPSSSPLFVQAGDGSAGWAVAASDGAVRFVIPNGTIIPPHGHFLGANSVGYSLTNYPGGNGPTTPDATWTLDIPDNAGIALFSSSTSLDFGHRIDSVGSTSEGNPLYKEGAGYPPLIPFSIDCAFYRTHLHGTPAINDPTIDLTDGEPHDSNDNAIDFVFVDTNGTSAGAGQRLGSPGPKGQSSPVAAYHAPTNLGMGLVDPTLTLADAPNRVRDFTSDPAHNSTFGSLEVVRTFTNQSSETLTRLRFRIVKLTTFPAPSGISDLRPISSMSGPVVTAGGSVPVSGTSLEQPPSQLNGGGWNSTFSVNDVSAATPLAPGASIAVRFHFGIQQAGTYRVALLAEGLPTVSQFWFTTGETDHPEASAESASPVISPEIALEQPAGHAIATGASASFTSQTAGTEGETKVFTINNTGPDPLHIADISIPDGTGDFTVDTSATVFDVPATNGSTTFAVTFAPTGVGIRQATLHVQSNDADEGIIDITLTGEGLPAIPTYGAVATKGDAVPHAGENPAIQQGATWSGFGVPSVNNAGQVAYLGKWKAPAFKTPVVLKAQSGAGIFVDDQLIVKAGDPVPYPGAFIFKSFKDPVLDDLGHVAFIASIGGLGVSSTNDTVVVTNGRDGALEVLAREGDTAPESDGAVFKGFSAVSIQSSLPHGGVAGAINPGSESGIVFTASLLRGSGTPAVTATSDTGAWWLPSGESVVTKVVREGDFEFGPTEAVKSFVILKGLSGSPGHGRGQTLGNGVLFQAGSTAGNQAIVSGYPDDFFGLAFSGDNINSSLLPDAVWARMDLPSSDLAQFHLSMLATLKPNVGGIKGANAKGIFLGTGFGSQWEPLARTGDPAPGIGRDAVFSAFKDPVNSPFDSGVAFLASTKNGGVTTADNDGIWWQQGGGELTLIAREGGQPPAAPMGAKWKTFSSLALPGGSGGPIFTASLQTGPRGSAGPGGVTSVEDFALYGLDGFGTLQELLRENGSLLGKTVKLFKVLKAVSGSPGVTHSYNSFAQIVALVTFTDNTVAIVRIGVPGPEGMIITHPGGGVEN